MFLISVQTRPEKSSHFLQPGVLHSSVQLRSCCIYSAVFSLITIFFSINKKPPKPFIRCPSTRYFHQKGGGNPLSPSSHRFSNATYDKRMTTPNQSFFRMKITPEQLSFSIIPAAPQKNDTSSSVHKKNPAEIHLHLFSHFITLPSPPSPHTNPTIHKASYQAPCRNSLPPWLFRIQAVAVRPL